MKELKSGRPFRPFISIVMACWLLSLSNPASAQGKSDSLLFTLKSPLFFADSFIYMMNAAIYPNYEISQQNNKTNQAVYNRYMALAGRNPDRFNFDAYFNLAEACWNLDKKILAEKLFVRIINSPIPQYNVIFRYGSDIPGDTSQNIYGYGSFTASYKHDAGLYLAKICLLTNRPKEALQYLKWADTRYPVYYTCGTGFRQQKEEMDYLYGRAYLDMKDYPAALNLLLPECLSRRDDLSKQAVLKSFQPAAIRDSLDLAEAILEFIPDSFQSISWTEKTDTKSRVIQSDTTHYISGRAQTRLFGVWADIPSPNWNDGEIARRADFLKQFRENTFITSLREYADHSQDSARKEELPL